ncbi:MAG: hypothetical protein HQL46_15370, partial [Gammaproteobacteria bacterium]|nr:hypothetical protein [Gammaproteobacteria bacterium]
MSTRKKNIGSISKEIGVDDFSLLLKQNEKDFKKIQEIAFCTWWFPQMYYRYWKEKNISSSLELWASQADLSLISGEAFNNMFHFQEVNINRDCERVAHVFFIHVSVMSKIRLARQIQKFDAIKKYI